MKLLLDEHYSAAIAAALRTKGHNVVALQDDDQRHLRGSSDSALFAVAQQLSRTVVTENIAHFRPLADACYARGESHAGLIYTNALTRHQHGHFVRAVIEVLDRLMSQPGLDAPERFLESLGTTTAQQRLCLKILCEDVAMIIVAGPITFNSDDWPALEAAFTTVREATLAEDGCLEYDAHPMRGQTGKALLFERWESADALAAHFKTPHIAAWRKAVKDLPSVTFGHTIYEATPHDPAVW